MPQFNGKNSLGARDLMISRSVYNGYVLTLLDNVNEPTVETLQIKDFQKDEKMLVGRIDHVVRNPIFPRTSYLKMFPRGTADDGIQALNFVVDAWVDMSKAFDQALKIGQVCPKSGSPFTELTVKKAYTNPLKQYDSYIEDTKKDFKKYVKESNRIKEISDFNSFVPIFMDYIKLTAVMLPVTRSMYFLTRYVPSRVSGLVLETYVGDYGDDQVKVDLFYKDRNFEYLKNLAYSYGFVIDKHIPWRFVADMNSPRMMPYIKNNFGGTSAGASTVTTIAFQRTYSGDIPSLIGLLVDCYNIIARYRPRTKIKEPAATINLDSTKTVFTNCKKVRTINRRPTTVNEVVREYSTAYWLDLYARVRNLETNMLYSEGILQEIINRSIDLSNSLDRPTALGYIVSKFDNIEHFEGSLFHDVTRLEMSEDPSATEASVTETVRRSVQASNFVVY